MNRRKWVILISTLALIAGGGVLLSALRANQRLGPPAVKTQPTDDRQRLTVILPERVLDYTSTNAEITSRELDMLPRDTSFGRKVYRAPDGFEAEVSVV